MNHDRFVERLLHLCLGSRLRGFPQRHEDLDIFLQSVSAELPKASVFSERSVDAAILRWLSEVGLNVEIDHVNIRRRLVDRGYLTRSRDGRRYYRTDRIVDVPDSRATIANEVEKRLARREAAEKLGRVVDRPR